MQETREIKQVRKLENFPAGAAIDDAIVCAKAVAKEGDLLVQFRFNGVSLEVDSDISHDLVKANYMAGLEKICSQYVIEDDLEPIGAVNLKIAAVVQKMRKDVSIRDLFGLLHEYIDLTQRRGVERLIGEVKFILGFAIERVENRSTEWFLLNNVVTSLNEMGVMPQVSLRLIREYLQSSPSDDPHMNQALVDVALSMGVSPEGEEMEAFLNGVSEGERYGNADAGKVENLESGIWLLKRAYAMGRCVGVAIHTSVNYS